MKWSVQRIWRGVEAETGADAYERTLELPHDQLDMVREDNDDLTIHEVVDALFGQLTVDQIGALDQDNPRVIAAAKRSHQILWHMRP